MEGYRLLRFDHLPKIKTLCHFEIAVNTSNRRLEISKCYTSYTFHPISVKLFEHIGYHSGIQEITFLGNRPNFEKEMS